MYYARQTPAERAHSAAAWAALVSGAMSPDPLPEEPCFTCGEVSCRCPVDCPECEGLGVVAHPRGHETACPRCWGDCTIPREPS